jgi:hypothetical protein
MGRGKSAEVDRAAFIEAVRICEEGKTFSNRSALYEAVANKYNEAGGKQPITPSVAYLRIKDWGLEVKTPLGKRGRGSNPNLGKIPKGTRVSKASKFKKDPAIQKSFAELKQIVPERYMPLYERTIKGSRTAAAKLLCLECSGWMSAEVRLCCAYSCPMWAFRGYQSNKPEEVAA